MSFPSPPETILSPPRTSSTLAGSDDPRRSLDDLVSRALAYRSGPELKALFDFARRFPHLAPYNAMLLHVQNPGIAYALRAFDWERKYQRCVKPAARPYVILRTMGPVAFVFDLSDTDPIDPARDLIPELVKNPFPAKGQPPPGAMAQLIAACLKVGIIVEERDFGTNLAGQVQRVAGPKPPNLTPAQQAIVHALGDLLGKHPSTPDFHITLNSKHTPAQQLGTLAHELAHVFCGHLGMTQQGFWADRSGTVHAVREFEAEAVAYLVTDRLNLDIGSVSYLAGYISSGDRLPDYSLDAALKAAGKLEEMMSGRFRLKRSKPAGE